MVMIKGTNELEIIKKILKDKKIITEKEIQDKKLEVKK